MIGSPQRKHRRRVAGIFGLKLWFRPLPKLALANSHFSFAMGDELGLWPAPFVYGPMLCAPSPPTLTFNFDPSTYAALCGGVPARTGVGSRPTKASAKGGRDTRFCSQVSWPLLALTRCKATPEPPTFDFQSWPMGLCCAKDTFCRGVPVCMDIRTGVDSGFPTKASAKGGRDQARRLWSRPLLT